MPELTCCNKDERVVIIIMLTLKVLSSRSYHCNMSSHIFNSLTASNARVRLKFKLFLDGVHSV
jgi:hypothetical protein